MPPKIKKGKKKKSKKIVETEEEKKARLEAELLIAEELRKKKEEDDRRRAVEKQKEEESVYRRNLALTIADLRQRARQLKLKELVEECDITAQLYERKIDQREAIIESLFRDIQEAERQYQIALRSHLSNLDNLIEIQHERFEVLESEMVEDTDEITRLHLEEKEGINNTHEIQKNELLQILQLMEERYDTQMAEDKKKFEEERKIVEEEQRNELMANKTNLSMRVDILTTALQELHKKYISNTEKQTQEFRLYAKKEQIDAQEIASLIRQIRRNQDLFQRVKKKIQNTVKEYTEKNSALQKEKDTINKHYHLLKAKMNQFRKNEENRLKALTMQTREVTLRLKDVLKLAEKVILSGELNRKMENEREKVLPFFPTVAETDEEIAQALRKLEEEEEEEDETLVMHLTASTKGQEGMSEEEKEKEREREKERLRKLNKITPSQQLHAHFSQLDQFFKRSNRALIDKLAIEHEHRRLERENADLREILRQYLEGITINESVSTSANPIMIIQPASTTITNTAVVQADRVRVGERV